MSEAKGAVRTAAVLMLCLFVGCAIAADKGSSARPSNKLYKWVDDKGVTHYTEQLPPEATGKGASQLNKQGTVVKTLPRADTPEEIAAQEAAEKKRVEAAELEKTERRKNEAVLSTYSSEKDVEIARERALEVNRDVIKNAQHNITEREKKKQEWQGKYGTAQTVPVRAKLELETLDNELAQYRQTLANKQREMAVVNAKYDEDKRRYITLRGSDAVVAKP